MTVAIYPWQQGLWDKLNQARRQNRLPHALLLSGPAGMGKAVFATYFAHSLLCQQPAENGAPCGRCKPCLLLQAGTHPDLCRVEPEEEGRQIKIEPIRELLGFSSLTANYGTEQVIILHPAESMNINAANSLLKLLEEPPGDTRLVLISHQPAALLATIRSRCQQFNFVQSDTRAALAWLQTQLTDSDADPALLLRLSNQAPLAALTLAEQWPQRANLVQGVRDLLNARQDPLQIAASWKELNPAQALRWLMSWIMDMIRCQHDPATISNQDLGELLTRIAARAPGPLLFKLLDEHQQVQRLLNASSNVKPEGLLEAIALAWRDLGQAARGKA